MRIIAFVSLCCLIYDSTSECPTDWLNRVHCRCRDIDYNPEITCSVNDASQLIVVSESYGHNLTTLQIRLHRTAFFPSSVLHYNSLTNLVIYSSELTFVDDDAFVDLNETLTSFTLSYSRLRKIPVSAISRLRKLENLNMKKNKLVDLKESLRSMPLRVLNLRKNRISEIGHDVLPESLVHLDLSRNNLKSLNGALRGDLTYLDISKNDIRSLYGELNEVPKLKRLIATDNRIHEIDKSFTKIQNIRVILLRYNFITDIHNGLRGLNRLRILDLHYNGLGFIDHKAFVDLKDLKNLKLSYNRLYHLDNDLFDCLINLRKLDISYNWLSDLDFLVSWEDLAGRAPDIHENCTFIYNSRLRSLNMENSGITCYDETRRAIKYLGRKRVIIKGNPCTRRG